METSLTTDMRWEVRKRAFRIWQRAPHRLAPMSSEQHTCQSCGTVFQGNYCPRCGQSASIGRFSFKKAFLLFLDIWGMGNRGMFRSMRDLLLRPGYMIRDYIGGCQSAYFPPFKMFFILATLSVLISHGIDLRLQDEPQTVNAQVSPEAVEEMGFRKDNKTYLFAKKAGKTMATLYKKNTTLFWFIMLLLASAPLYLFMRRCPAIPDLRYSEHVVALVYTANMNSVYQMLAELMPFRFLSSCLHLAAFVMIFVALKQLTGYSKRRLLWYFTQTFFICLGFLVIVGFLVVSLLYLNGAFVVTE